MKNSMKTHWEKEGYTLKFIKGGDVKIRSEGLKYKVNNLDGDVAVFAVKDKQLAGWLLVTIEDKKTISPLNVKVREAHRRKGLASAMYILAEQKTKRKMERAAVQSNDAEKLWSQPNRNFGKE